MYEPLIGLEIHAQLLTRTKLFCGCSTQYGRPPNSQTCPVCLGLPGALPVLNREAVTMAIKLALAVKANIQLSSVFSRKNYFYPDLPKGYQITQYHSPFATAGQVQIDTGPNERTIKLERISVEEDAGKSIHDNATRSSQNTYLDFNRSGVALLEIVSKPEMNSPAEAVEFLQSVRTILQYLKICDGNMEEGNLRFDANLSVREKGSQKMGVKTEIKNLNSFRFLHKALEYETERQIELLGKEKSIQQETRLWDTRVNKTLPMRSKEEAHDYRYFPEPDLPPLVISQELIRQVRRTLPELPQEKVQRFHKHYGIPISDAKFLASSRELSDYFEQTALASGKPKQAVNWIRREVLQYLKERNIPITQFSVPPKNLAEVISLVEKKEITHALAKGKIFPQMIQKKKGASQIIKEERLNQVQDGRKIREVILRVLEKNPKPLRQHQQGKVQTFGYFMGQVMKETKDQVDPHLIHKALKEILDSLKSKTR